MRNTRFLWLLAATAMLVVGAREAAAGYKKITTKNGKLELTLCVGDVYVGHGKWAQAGSYKPAVASVELVGSNELPKIQFAELPPKSLTEKWVIYGNAPGNTVIELVNPGHSPAFVVKKINVKVLWKPIKAKAGQSGKLRLLGPAVASIVMFKGTHQELSFPLEYVMFTGTAMPMWNNGVATAQLMSPVKIRIDALKVGSTALRFETSAGSAAPGKQLTVLVYVIKWNIPKRPIREKIEQRRLPDKHRKPRRRWPIRRPRR